MAWGRRFRLPGVKFFTATVDYQHVDNPAFNHDRGPVSVFSLRLDVGQASGLSGQAKRPAPRLPRDLAMLSNLGG